MRAWIALTALALSAFLYVTTETLPVGLLPQISTGLGVSTAAAGLLVTAYGLVVVLATLPLTRLTQRWPRRRLLSALLLAFALATALSAAAPNYPTLVGARVAAALSQAVFWAAVVPTAAGLFRAESRGRAIAVLYAGSSAAPLLGVPGGTWLGQQLGWRYAFLLLAGLGLAVLALIATAMPDARADRSAATHGSAPDRGRYRLLTVTTALTVTGAFAAFTYLTPFLTDVTGVSATAIGPLLFARGAAGLLGALLGGLLPTRSLAALVAVQAAALFAQHAWSGSPVPVVLATSAAALSLSALSTVLAVRILEVAPGRTDLASAGASTAFNVGITAGALIGGLLVAGPGLRAPVLAGALITVAALATTAAEPWLATSRRATHTPERPSDNAPAPTPQQCAATPSSPDAPPTASRTAAGAAGTAGTAGTAAGTAGTAAGTAAGHRPPVTPRATRRELRSADDPGRGRGSPAGSERRTGVTFAFDRA
jgi:MFS transporter, DHA1 family, inner membrane transport protein